MPQESNASAQSKMGELFVDFGVKGVGGLLKSLNGIQAQFLLTKTAADQAIKPLIGMSKTAAGTVTELSKISAVTGLTVKQLQDLRVWSQLNNVSFGELAGQIKTMQQNLLDIRMGKGDISGYALLGIDPNSLDYRKPMEAFNEIRKRVQQVDEATGAAALRQLGFSEDLLFVFRQQNKELDKRIFSTDKELKALLEQQKAWNNLGITISQTTQRFIANQKWITSGLEIITQLVNNLNDLWSDVPNPAIAPEDKTSQKNLTLGQKIFTLPFKTALEIINPSKYATEQKKTVDPFKNKTTIQKSPQNYTPNSLMNTGVQAAPQNYMPMNTTTSNNDISINQYIYGGNSQQIAQEAGDRISQELNNMEIMNGAVV